MSLEEQQEQVSASRFPRNWVYLKSSEKSSDEIKQQVEKLVGQIRTDKNVLHDIFYEVMLALTDEESGHMSKGALISVVNGILKSYVNIKERESVSIDLMIILQSVKPTKQMIPFFEMLDIDKDLKIQYLDPFILKNSFFPEYNKAYYVDAKTNDYGLEMYSSLGESSEGYSRFITGLCGLFRGRSSIDWPDFMSRLEIIIGHFKLDTNRCFLLVISVLGLNFGPNPETVKAFLDNCNWWARDSSVNTSISTTIVAYLSNRPVLSSGELIVIFLMTEKKWLDLGVVLSVLEPSDLGAEGDASMDEIYEKQKREMKERAFRETASALALAAPLLPDEEDDEHSGWAHERNAHSATAHTATAHTATAHTPTALTPITPAATAHAPAAEEEIQQMAKIRFISYIIKLRAHSAIVYALAQYPYLPQMDERIADLLNEYLRYMLAPLYRKIVKHEDIDAGSAEFAHRITDIDGLFSISDQLLRLNGAKIARSPLLLAQLGRIMDGELAAGAERNAWLQYFKVYLFPAMNCNLSECICNEIFDIFCRHFTLEERYNVYGEYISVTVKKAPF
ncbi:hypothetical protein HII13_000232 [Brettanomyces bruxellensis]|nr:hypothetical protein HII13_000232 [Brettanomyces bruxellensis]